MTFQDRADELLGKDLDPATRVVLERLIEAIQANFDHLSGEAIGNTKVFNIFVDQLQEKFDQLIADIIAEIAEHSHSAEEVAEGDGTAITVDHDDLTGVSADDHHAQGHNHTTGDSSGVLTADEHDTYSEIAESSDPSAPGANKARLYVKDNGAGKTQLVVLFPSGAVQVLVTEP